MLNLTKTYTNIFGFSFLSLILVSCAASISPHTLLYAKEKETFYIMGSKGALLKTCPNLKVPELIYNGEISNSGRVYFSDSLHGFANEFVKKIYKTVDGGYTWHSLESFPNLYILDLCVADSLTVYVISANGEIRKTQDAGQSWIILGEKLPQGSRFLGFSDPNHGMVYSGKGKIFQTDDGGETWFMTNLDATRWILDYYFASNDELYLLEAGGNIFKTEDGGNNWIKLKTGIGEIIKDFCFVNDTGYILGLNGLWKSIDGGNHWKEINRNMGRNLLSIHFKDPSTGYLVSYNGPVLKTIDGGESWQEDLFSIDLLKETDFDNNIKTPLTLKTKDTIENPYRLFIYPIEKIGILKHNLLVYSKEGPTKKAPALAGRILMFKSLPDGINGYLYWHRKLVKNTDLISGKDLIMKRWNPRQFYVSAIPLSFSKGFEAGFGLKFQFYPQLPLNQPNNRFSYSIGSDFIFSNQVLIDTWNNIFNPYISMEYSLLPNLLYKNRDLSFGFSFSLNYGDLVKQNQLDKSIIGRCLKYPKVLLTWKWKKFIVGGGVGINTYTIWDSGDPQFGEIKRSTGFIRIGIQLNSNSR